MQTNRLLVLIDIDGTMITPGMTPRKSLAQAIFECTGKQVSFEVGQLAGLTDPLIIENTLKQIGIPPGNDGLPSQILERYLKLFIRDYPVATDKKVFPGVFDLLEFLKTQSVRMGLLTGNVHRGAQTKLTPLSLWHYFGFGVFGDDSADRNELPLIALDKVKTMFGETYRPQQVVVIGDTLNDVLCAHRNAMQSVIVLRHPEWRPAISAEKPELMIDSFEPLAPLRDWLKELIRQD